MSIRNLDFLLRPSSVAVIGVDARIEFTRTEGKVSGLILRQGGRELTATRGPG